MRFYMHKSIIVSVSMHFQRSRETSIINQLKQIEHTLLLLLFAMLHMCIFKDGCTLILTSCPWLESRYIPGKGTPSQMGRRLACHLPPSINGTFYRHHDPMNRSLSRWLLGIHYRPTDELPLFSTVEM